MCCHPGVCGASIPGLPRAAGSEDAQVTHIHASVYIRSFLDYLRGLPLWLSGKESACNAGDAGSTPASGRSPGESNGNPLQHSFLPGEFHGWRSLAGYSPWGCKESDMMEVAEHSQVTHHT